MRIWPGLVVTGIVALIRLGLPLVHPEPYMYVLMSGLGGAVLITIWWLFFSRAPWTDRLLGLAFIAAAAVLTWSFLHPSIATGHMGYMFYFYALPMIVVALPVGVWIGRAMTPAARRATIALVVFAAGGWFLLLRTDGVGSAGSQIQWRWAPTAEDRLLAQAEPAPTVPAAPAPAAPPPDTPVAPAPIAPAEWPGFRGPQRDGVVKAAAVATDWSTTPPVELWRRPIGPGWSSFAVRGDLLYTQEQRGDDELVSAYRVSTGEPVWRHRDATRFWESNGGAGPRSTPTIHGDRIFALGATGILNALDAATGRRVWSVNIGTDTSTKVPMWGFASSPLVQGDVVIVAAAGKLVAYDVATGVLRWRGPVRPGGYTSPHRLIVAGQTQVMLMHADGAVAVDPVSGAVLWEHAWDLGAPIVQPAVLPDGDVLINAVVATGGVGLRRLHVSGGAGAWQVEERWTSAGLKPYFNDFVIHQGHAYGFDGSILSCINLETGARTWKGGRYGNGQMVLLPEQDLLLVLSEDGELALVDARPGAYREVTRRPALDGKTWNHPVVIGDLLFVRNGEAMVAFRLPALK